MIDILSRLRPSYEKPRRQQKYVDPDPRKEAENARHLAKYVFPRQYGLSSPFCPTIQSKRDAFKIREYSDRENEIKTKGSCKTPKRLKDVLGLLDKIIWRHGKCAYKPLRDKTCPSKVSLTH
ncbi:hypothetical protein PLICRDRAFT_116545 [Plicaturopsis crispa FD-325 SS-3]|uniref:Uncharacterized protein n=1 Tax=Plicaturopsis crispa FD-325 SS-3 TaxID=944288 RepID=A0A0C9SS15_PLICR|nr:hypothetical protein PLICRDRAFT_116545 [Plicaturopsis crispa FD-325 SS-3]